MGAIAPMADERVSIEQSKRMPCTSCADGVLTDALTEIVDQYRGEELTLMNFPARRCNLCNTEIHNIGKLRRALLAARKRFDVTGEFTYNCMEQQY